MLVPNTPVAEPRSLFLAVRFALAFSFHYAGINRPHFLYTRSNQCSIGVLLVRALFHRITGNKIGAGVLVVLVCYIGR
ncbi:hypothetical protein B0H14DRAFT_2749966, partial [Mycena olivaceomarginata]